MDAIEHALDILGLGPDATPQHVKQAYRDLVKVWHPDRFPNDSRVRRKAEEKLKEINEAYRTLQGYDPDSRARSRTRSGPTARPNPTQSHYRASGPKSDSSSPPIEPSVKSEPASSPPKSRKRVLCWGGIILVILALAKGFLRESPTILMRFADEMAGSTATAARVVGRSAKSLNQEPSPERVSTESIEPFEKDSILNDAQAYINRGMEKAARDQHLAAIADYDRAIRLKPNEAVAFVNRGVAKYRLGLYRAAVADFDTAIRLSPDNPYAYYSRGVVKYRLSRRREARQDFQTASLVSR